MDLVENLVLKRHKPIREAPRVGSTVDVHIRFQESGKERVQVFSGVVLKVQGKKSTRSITVRKMASGVGVERTFPLASPVIQKINLISRAKVRRSRLFYLRNLKGRLARLQTLSTSPKGEEKKEKPPQNPPEGSPPVKQ